VNFPGDDFAYGKRTRRNDNLVYNDHALENFGMNIYSHCLVDFPSSGERTMGEKEKKTIGMVSLNSDFWGSFITGIIKEKLGLYYVMLNKIRNSNFLNV